MKILVGYDGSDVAKQTLELAKKIAIRFSGDVVVATSFMIGEDAQQFIEEIKRARKELQAIEDSFSKTTVPCRTELLRRGMHPGEDLVTFAQEISADLIIVGIQRQSKIGKLFLGSNAQYIILNAPCPVVSINKFNKVWE
jgi:nucleotide-binding universal stress UspA family protein